MTEGEDLTRLVLSAIQSSTVGEPDVPSTSGKVWVEMKRTVKE